MNMMGKIWQNRKNVLRYPIASSKLAASDPSTDNDTVGRILRHPESQSSQQAVQDAVELIDASRKTSYVP